MIDIFLALGPVAQALIATLFTWGMTALGAVIVFAFRNLNQRMLNALLGFAGGVMLAAACWSLLIPAMERAAGLGMPVLTVTAGGFVCGGVLMLLGDIFLASLKQKDGEMDVCSRMLMFSLTLHNIPEGLCVGVAFGAAAMGLGGASAGAACMLALGIGLQNFPEGAVVSLPMLRGGMSRRRAFFMGQISGVVEPLAAVLGAALVTAAQGILPFMLSFAAGAMVYAVAGEIFPESRDTRRGLAALFAIIGFALMMVLDIILG